MMNQHIERRNRAYVRRLPPHLQEFLVDNFGFFPEYGRFVIEVHTAQDFDYLVSQHEILIEHLEDLIGRKVVFAAIFYALRLNDFDTIFLREHVISTEETSADS